MCPTLGAQDHVRERLRNRRTNPRSPSRAPANPAVAAGSGISSEAGFAGEGNPVQLQIEEWSFGPGEGQDDSVHIREKARLIVGECADIEEAGGAGTGHQRLPNEAGGLGAGSAPQLDDHGSDPVDGEEIQAQERRGGKIRGEAVIAQEAMLSDAGSAMNPKLPWETCTWAMPVAAPTLNVRETVCPRPLRTWVVSIGKGAARGV